MTLNMNSDVHIPAFRKRFSRELDVAGRAHSPRVAEIYNAQTEGTTSHPATHPSTAHTTTTSPPAQPTHTAPGSVTGVGANIPAWFGEATVNTYWNVDAGATSYVLHYNIDGGGDQYVPVNGTSSSYMLPAGSTSCIQVQAVNQYGKSAYAPSPPLCFNSAGQQVGS